MPSMFSERSADDQRKPAREGDAMEEMMDRCMETMGSMIDGGLMGMDGRGWLSGLLLVGLLLLVLGVATLGALGIWAFRRFRHSSTQA